MKILLSAYACEPNKGSEPNVGWNWALGLKKIGHEITVITRDNNKSSIYRELKKKKIKNIKFLFYDLPGWLIFFKNKSPIFLYIYYYLWQYFAFKKYHNYSEKNDLVHHITFGTFRIPSFFWKSKTPLIFGPVGGAETTPFFLIKDLKLDQKIKEILKYIFNFLQIKFDYNLIKCLKNSKYIVTRTNETKNLINKCFKNKINVVSEIGIKNSHKKKITNKKVISFLFAGRHIYWKGGTLIIDAFNQALKINKNIKLNFVGGGPDKHNWVNKVNSLGIEKFVNFHNWQKLDSMKNFYKKNDVFIFPSFHDSGGTVINEAMSYSLPIICLDLGGPALKVDENCGFVISTKSKNLDKAKIVKKMSKKILQLANDKKLIKKLSYGSYIKSKKYNWDKIIKDVYNNI